MVSKNSPASFVVESGRPLSKSLLWSLQARYFQEQGIAAWTSNTVPSYITSNPYIARAYARVAAAYVRDLLPTLDPSQPVYLLELGAGSGRFAFYFLQTLRRHLRLLLDSAPGTRVCYVLSDYAHRNVRFWREHPAFAPFVDDGMLDFCRFDPLRESTLTLEHSGQVLSPGALKNPLIVMGNYFFDSIPQDVFRLEGGDVACCMVTLASDRREPDRSDPAMLRRLSITFEPRACPEAYYHDPELDDLLERYRASLADTYLLFPCAAIRVLRKLAALSAGRLLLLAGDTAQTLAEDLDRRSAPDIRIHGSFSMRVNFHALGEWTRARGGRYLHAAHRPAQIAVCGFLLGDHPSGFVETERAFSEAVEQGGPDEFFLIKRAVEKNYSVLDLEELLAYLRTSGWDPRLFLDAFPALLEKAPSASPRWQEEICRAVEATGENYYHIGEERDLPFSLGVLLYRLGRVRRALHFFESSLALYGSSTAALYNAAMCSLHLGDAAAARERTCMALEIDPNFEPALSLSRQIKKN